MEAGSERGRRKCRGGGGQRGSYVLFHTLV